MMQKKAEAKQLETQRNAIKEQVARMKATAYKWQGTHLVTSRILLLQHDLPHICIFVD